MSNRLSVLTALDKHGKSTYGELEFNTGLTRKQLLQAVNDAKKAGHILSGKDDLTGQPAYTITPKGREWMAAMPQTVEVKLPIPTAVSNPVVKESSTTEQPKVLNQVIREFRTTEDENLRQQVAHLNDQLAGEKSNLQKAEAELETAETFNVRWLDLARKYDCKSISELHEYITRLAESKVAEITAKQPIGFVVSAPKQPMRRFKNNGTAKAQALSFARNFGTGEVFAIYPAGKAVRGAEWKEPS